MKWQGRRGSSNIEDRRSMGATGAGGIGVVGTLVVLAVGYFFGVDITPVIRQIDQSQNQTQQGRQGSVPLTQEDQRWGDFVSVVLADTEEVWAGILPEQAGMDYRNPTLVLYGGVVQSACGGASAAMGPFYCPNDQKVYLDTDFFNLMAQKMGAGGDFAYAYVIAHEVGHHVQNLVGTLSRVNASRQRISERDSNALSVLTELQADCYAGVWAGKNSDLIEPGDFEEGMEAAAAIGDDAISERMGGRASPESFTHGTSEQRMEALRLGMRSGDDTTCDRYFAPESF